MSRPDHSPKNCLVLLPFVAAWAVSFPLLVYGFSPHKACAYNRGTIVTSSTLLQSKSNVQIYSEVDSKSTNGDAANDTVDRAPCFDGICDSQPVDGEENVSIKIDGSSESVSASIDTNGTAGGAILRLGTMTGPTVWSEFGRISQECDVANLGQGMMLLRLCIRYFSDA